jgi:predicted transcriptional regulator
MADDTLLALVADIVSAQVSHNSVSANELPSVIKSVYDSLSKLGKVQAPVEEKRTPAVPIRLSVKPSAIKCLECGAEFKMLKRHLSTDHNLTPDAYRARWSLSASYPLVASDYAAKRKALAIKIGLGRKPAPAAAPEPVKAKAPRRKQLTPNFDGAIPPTEG